MKKALFILLILPLLAGCYARRMGIPLFNNHGYHYTPNSVTVQRGDTLYSLSKRYEVPLRSLIEENNLSSPYTLNVGQRLSLPTRPTYTVVKGDTLYGIAKKKNVDITSLSKLNGLSEPYAINEGQVLALPQDLSNSKSTYREVKIYETPQNQVKNNNQKESKEDNKKAIVPVKKINIASSSSSSRKNVSTYRKSKFMWPVNGSVVSNFGVVGKGRRNDGINIKAAMGTNVKAADKGVVAYAGNELKGFGNLVLIKHSDGYITAYAHNDKLYVKKGQTVLRGEKIATVGSTGSVNTPQLHFEVRAGKKAVNPRTYLP